MGWGLKTIGRYYPETLISFLKAQQGSDKKISNLMWRKAMKYLDEDEKAEILRGEY